MVLRPGRFKLEKRERLDGTATQTGCKYTSVPTTTEQPLENLRQQLLFGIAKKGEAANSSTSAFGGRSILRSLWSLRYLNLRTSRGNCMW